MVPFLPHRSHPDIHCWLNFYISSPPCFVCSTRFKSGSSWIHRIHWNHYQHFLQSPYPVPPICWWHTRLRPLLRHWCPSAFIPPVGLCQRLEFTLFITLPAAQPSKIWIYLVWFYIQPGQDLFRLQFPYCGIFIHALCLHCVQSWCDIWLRIIHEVAHQQNCNMIMMIIMIMGTPATVQDVTTTTSHLLLQTLPRPAPSGPPSYTSRVTSPHLPYTNAPVCKIKQSELHK